MTNKSRGFISTRGPAGIARVSSTWTNGAPYTLTSYEAMETFDSGRGWRSALGEKDIGNPWVKEAWLAKAIGKMVHMYAPSYQYDGPLWSSRPRNASIASDRSNHWPALPAATMNLIAAGTTAISRCAPTTPAADTLVGLAEIYREGIPHMAGATLKRDIARFRETGKIKHLPNHQSLSDEFLNYQFGWKPLVNDLKKLSKAIYESDELISQLQKNSGKIVRRSYNFPAVETNSGVGSFGEDFYSSPQFYPLLVTAGRTKYRQTMTSYRVWFSGAFTYYVDLKGLSAYDRVTDFAQRARLLYGIKLTPDVAWNLMPWSWLIDWNTNIGDIITNVGLFSNDGLVMHYGYVMQERKARQHSYMEATYKISGGTAKAQVSDYFEHHQKYRVRATPWGFGLDSADYTPRQWAILAALGITRI